MAAANWLIDCLTDAHWLNGWLIDCLSDWWLSDWSLTDWLPSYRTMPDWWLVIYSVLSDWLTDWLAGWPTNWLTDRLTNWPTDWLTLTVNLYCALLSKRRHRSVYNKGRFQCRLLIDCWVTDTGSLIFNTTSYIPGNFITIPCYSVKKMVILSCLQGPQ